MSGREQQQFGRRSDGGQTAARFDRIDRERDQDRGGQSATEIQPQCGEGHEQPADERTPAGSE